MLLLATKVWEQRKLGKVATFINGRAYKQNELLDSGKYKVLRVGNFYTNDSWYYSNLELADKYYIDKGDLVYTWSATFGPHIWDGEKVIYHYHIWKIELSKFLDRDFTLQILEADKAKLLANTNGSTMIHVTKKDMESKVISLPIIEEQKQIGLYLTKFDTLIALYEKKKQLLTQLKQGIVNFLITKNGQKPQLRFSGFNNNWESKSFEKLLNYEQPTKYIVKKADYISQGTPVLTANKSFVLGYTNETNVYQNIPAIIFDDFTLESKYVDFPFMVKSSAIKILTSENSNLFFIYQLLNNQRFVQEGHSRHYISVVQKKKVLVPSIQEQNKISDLIKQLEDNIELNSNTIVLLKKLKEFLLQSMFL